MIVKNMKNSSYQLSVWFFDINFSQLLMMHDKIIIKRLIFVIHYLNGFHFSIMMNLHYSLYFIIAFSSIKEHRNSPCLLRYQILLYQIRFICLLDLCSIIRIYFITCIRISLLRFVHQNTKIIKSLFILIKQNMIHFFSSPLKYSNFFLKSPPS